MSAPVGGVRRGGDASPVVRCAEISCRDHPARTPGEVTLMALYATAVPAASVTV